MALDNPVLPTGVPKIWLSSRWFELTLVVAMTVAVVAFAALWGNASESERPLAADQAGQTVEPAAVAAPAATGVASGSRETAPVDSAGSSTLVADSAALTDPGASTQTDIPEQTGVVPGRPDPVALTLPRSFERYQVQRGESLFSIATARGISVADLVSWNWQLDADSVLIRGEWLWIPQWDLSSVAEQGTGATDSEKSGRGGG